ncbi:putative methyltransferase YcgJ [Oxobacter pfennigii]|uniref:Putative methyltransferase YcgJ n=1 Tax=Oxobacter pfennigii TaxID=36849 RepID=A0A0P9AF73_9CLOT|nr:class I SAM-dependent methyltransferase [Oxobacter pfennigii]KPU44010.1 putative methyltransferase YcgJ [Oxobacter pfennigii]
MDIRINADRFNGFAETYKSARPAMPFYPVKTIIRYLGNTPDRIVDLGCGTGLSTVVWSDYCSQIIGVEPSTDMITVAKRKANNKISFINAFSHDTGIESDSSDVVICSQSFHWMEPIATLTEVNRILKAGGVFATVDCDWPPVSIWQADQAYDILYKKVRELEEKLPDVKDTFIRYNKEEHLSNIKNSCYFRYAREIVFSNTELCTSERFINIIISQGSLQAIITKYPELLLDDIVAFKNKIIRLFQDEMFEIDFSYRMRLAVK